MDDAVTIVTGKKIDAVNAPLLEKQLNAILDEGEISLIIDMKDTTYISSMGLRVFLAAQKKIRVKNGNMVLMHVMPQVMEVFDVTGFSGLLTFGDD
ncbi:MAG: STAS domain-containing protein [Eubacteriales bacterium]|nr:STAS domain-containing protein [Eubacteriales bacterium]